MKKALLIIAILFTTFLVYILWPRHYNVSPAKKRPSTQYWNLPGGSRIAYSLARGKGAKKSFPLIYLHGGPGAGITDLEINLLSSLADDGYDVYLYDQVGCGRSSRLRNIKEYTAGRQKRDLEEIVKVIGAGKVVFIAQSWGSILSLLYLADNPQKVEKIIVTAPGNIQPPRHELAEIYPPDSLHLREPYAGNRAALIQKDLRPRLAIFLLKKYGWKLLGDAEADQLQTYLTNEINRSMVCDKAKAVTAESSEGFYVHYMTIKSLDTIPDPRPRLINSPVPVCIMKGQCDNQKWGYTTEYFKLFPNHKLKVIPGAGHNIFIEQPGEYLQTIREFLKH